jgi:AcrR family transcriptional regulator
MPMTRALSERLREQRAEAVVSEVEQAALLLFDERGFSEVSVQHIASEAGISVRTFYRHFSTKEDVLSVRTRRGAERMRAALAAQPSGDPPLHSLRIVAEELASEDQEYVGRWMRVVASSPSVLAVVMGAIQLVFEPVLRDFFAERLDLPNDSLAVWTWASAAEGAIQAAQIRWYVSGGDLTELMCEAMKILEEGVGANRPAKNVPIKERNP